MPSTEPTSKKGPGSLTKLIFNVLRWAIPAAILAYLFYDIFQTGGVSDVRIDSKNWYLLVVSVL